MIRVVLPVQLRRLANVGKEVQLQVNAPVSQATILDALEKQYPMLKGTIRDQKTHQRRDFIRFFVCGEDWSHLPNDTPLPDAIADGSDRFLIIGAMAGG